MENGAKTLKYVKYDYIINEMIDDMKKSMLNLQNVIDGQNELISYLEKADNKKFEGFIGELKKSSEQYEKQVKTLAYRLCCIEKVKDCLNEFAEASYMLSMLLEAFGIANKEAKTIEERASNNEDIASLDIKCKA